MKKLIAALCLVPAIAFAGGEMKKVCHKEVDKKGKEVEVCKTIKVHAKLDPTGKPGQK